MAMQIENLANNQVVVTQENGARIFNSYGVNVAKIEKGKVTLDSHYWDYSKTTTKYLSKCLWGENKATIKAKIDSGEYTLGNLN